MKRKIAALVFVTLAFTFAFTGCIGGSSSHSDSYLFVKNMGSGWNLGNTLDAYSDSKGKSNYGVSTETCWGMPQTTKAMIHAVAQRGFKTVRIPVSWHNHITDENLTIDPVWIARVKQIVDWAIEEDLYVIINIHHDNAKSSSSTGNSLKNIYGFTVNSDSEEQETSLAYISAVWRQVAETFSEYDEHLIFETLNEPRNRDASNDGFTPPENLYDLNRLISRYNQAALEAIRNAGGRNETRYVMVPFYAASPYHSSGWKLPEDSAENRIIISVHAYTPYTFCMSTTENKTFEEYDEGREIDYLFTLLNDEWKDRGYGVVIGETSASDKNNTKEREEWAEYFFNKAKKSGMCAILWDNNVTCKASGGTGDINSGECHGYFKRSSLTWYFDSIINKAVD